MGSSSSWTINSSTIVGIFFSLNIIASILVLAIWDFKTHSPDHNILYIGLVSCSFVLNTVISICLQKGFRENRPNLLLPFIITATFHLTISLGAVFLFTISLLDHVFKDNDLQDFYGVLAFALLFFFWIFSIDLVQRDRERIQKICGIYQELLPEYI